MARPILHCFFSPLLLIAFIVLTPSRVSTRSDWDYNGEEKGPPSWRGACQTGTRQSPIDIVKKHTSPVMFDKMRFDSYNYLLNYNNVTLHNNGHTVKIEIPSFQNSNDIPHIKDGGLETIYELDHIHFHAGSEHTFNGRRYPLEAHLVHYDRRSGSVSSALKTRDGIAVLGVLFHLSDSPNSKLHSMVDALDKLSGIVGGRVALEASRDVMPLTALIPSDTEAFFRYYGSLTTPSCDEVVVWTVFEKTIPISEEQLKYFQMPDSNFRPNQDINRRFVLRNGPNAWQDSKWKDHRGSASDAAPSAYHSSHLAISASLALMLTFLYNRLNY